MCGLDVVLRDGLTSRHSHVFELVCVGVRRAREIATAGAMAYDTARDPLAKLVDAGMLNRQAVELGGMEKRAELAVLGPSGSGGGGGTRARKISADR